MLDTSKALELIADEIQDAGYTPYQVYACYKEDNAVFCQFMIKGVQHFVGVIIDLGDRHYPARSLIYGPVKGSKCSIDYCLSIDMIEPDAFATLRIWFNHLKSANYKPLLY